jgi:signal transduction histidine kinase
LQDALSNVLRHAQATEVWVHLRHDAAELKLAIRDDGIGFDRDAVREDDGRKDMRLGLFAMQMRAKQVGGSVQIESAPGRGTEVQAVFPLPDLPVEAVGPD